jgi:adenosyl cobinamide kinase/adenosyl cobinamide phosphate guanylyltransferase
MDANESGRAQAKYGRPTSFILTSILLLIIYRQFFQRFVLLIEQGEHMNLKAKIYAQENKQAAQKNLQARMALLESKGVAETVIQKDTLVRKFKADIRVCNRRLAGVAAQEKLIARKLEEREAKGAAVKQTAEPEQPEPKPAKSQKKEKKARKK